MPIPLTQALGPTESRMSDTELVRSLRYQSTWRLLGLGLITYGVYYAHYIARQSRAINNELPPAGKISTSFVWTTYFLSYACLALFIAYLFVDDAHPIAKLSTLLDRLWFVLIIVWGFVARNRMNHLLGLTKSDPNWFHGGWTFLFSPLYFNYRINVMSEQSETPTAMVDA